MSKSDLTVFSHSSESIQTSLTKSANVAMALQLLVTSGFQDTDALSKICNFLNDSIEDSQVAMLTSVMSGSAEGVSHEHN